MKYFWILMMTMGISACTTHRNLPVEELEATLKGDLTVSTGYADVGGLSMHYWTAGSGPAMILVHGWMCSGVFWKPMIESLAEKYTVYAVDMMGCGMSDKPLAAEPAFSTENQARWILRFMDAMAIDTAYVVGHSMGGETSLKIALLAPERVRRLVIIDAVGLRENRRILPWYHRLGLMIPFKDPVRWFFTEPLNTAVARRDMYYEKNPVDKEFIVDLVLQNTNTEQDARSMVKHTKDGLLQDFVDDRVASLNVDTQIIWARHDVVVPLVLGETYHSLIPQSEFHVLEDAGHMVPWEKTEEVLALVTGFCR